MTRHLPAGGGTPREVSNAINQVISGKINSVGTVTLNAGATSTTVNNPLVSKSSAIAFQAQTAHAAAIATPYVTQANITEGASFVITHVSNANVDLDFSYVILG